MRDIESLLRTSDPAADTPDYSDDQRRDLLATAITAEPRQPRRRIRIAAAAVAGALALGMGGFAVDATVAEARADDALKTAAINVVDVPTRPGQYWQVSTVDDSSGAWQPEDDGYGIWCVARERVEYYAYYSVDGTQKDYHYNAEREFVELMEGDPKRCHYKAVPAEAFASTPEDNKRHAGWSSPTPEFLATLPRDVDALRDELYKAGEKIDDRPDDMVAHETAHELLRSPLVPADLRAALFEVLRTVPGTTSSGTRTIDGVEGVVIGHRSGWGVDHEFVIDPANGQMIAEIIRDGSPGGRETIRTQKFTLVDEVPADFKELAGG